MKLWGQIALIAALGAAGTGTYFYRDKIPFLAPPSAAPQAVRAGGGPPALPVEAVAVKRMDVVRTLEAVGTAQANEAVSVTAKANGIVDRINFQEGQMVKTGSILVELEAGESNAKLAELRAARDAARLAYDRATALAESRNVAQARVDELSKAFEAAEARLRGEQAKFADSVIRAPFSGKLGMRRVSLGALVRPGDAITTLDDTSIIKLEFEVPETALSGIAVGNAVMATASAVPGRKFEGKVTVINSRVDPTTRAVRVRAQIPNSDDAIKPGMFMTVALSIGTTNNAIVVPEESLLAMGGEQFVYVIRDGRATRTRVRVGQRLPGMAQILDGLDAEARVAITGLQQLRDGMAVRPPGPPPGQAPGQVPGQVPGKPAAAKPAAS